MVQNQTITAQAADRLDGIISYFSSTKLQTEHVSFFVISVVVVIALIWGGAMLVRWKARRAVYIPTDTISKSNDILTVLNLCIDTRVKMDFQLERGRANLRLVSCMIVDIKDNSIVFECSIISISLAQLKQEKELNFFFTVKNKAKIFHYRFTGNIVKTTVPKDNFFYLHVEVPKKILPGQKRNFLRIQPPDKLIMGISLWPIIKKETSSFEPSTRVWGKSTFNYRTEEGTHFEVDDISANGISLRILRTCPQLQSLPLSKASSFAMLLDLWDPISQGPLKIWTICLVQRSVQDIDTKELHVGTQFVWWGQSVQTNPGFIKWKQLYPEEEIIILADWIIQRHLEEFRDRTDNASLSG